MMARNQSPERHACRLVAFDAAGPASTALPAIGECVAALIDYAAAMDEALAQTPRDYPGALYLPTARTIREAESAAHLLMASASALSQAPHFAAEVPVPGGHTRPGELVSVALEAATRANNVMNAHQGSDATPRANRLGLVVLAEWVSVTANDLRALLVPVLDLMGGRQ